ncbi:glycosyltransferase family A protein [Anabaena sp. UHCC 0187]|uniref:glycosyltransferase family 2 protein n=1 Tax=Anabaena sp. UHCC 0187 TaxID=2590018 RepID=UPI0020C459F0|nr:glycosyltransferase family A protein [Anabaena sp. UHCC 0187]
MLNKTNTVYKSMDVAVIITLFNGEKWIRQTLESVLSQEHPPSEVVVVDDGSEDNSPEMVRAFSGVKLIRNPSKGAQSACNFGFQHTQAELVTFLDHDDIWHPSHLRLMNDILEQHPECPAAIATCQLFESDDSLVFPPPKLNAIPFDPWEIFPVAKIPTNSAVVIRRTEMNKLGGWPIQFGGCTDTYTWQRLSVTQPLIENRTATVGYRQHEQSMSIDLRSQQTLNYFQDAIATSEDALNYRLEIHPQDTDKLTNRLAFMKPMLNILEATIHSDTQLLKESFLAFEKCLVGESDAFIQLIVGQLIWFITPKLGMQAPRRKTELLKILIRRWLQEPENTYFTLLFRIQENLPIWTAWQYLLLQPQQINVWRLFIHVVKLRILWNLIVLILISYQFSNNKKRSQT